MEQPRDSLLALENAGLIVTMPAPKGINPLVIYSADAQIADGFIVLVGFFSKVGFYFCKRLVAPFGLILQMFRVSCML